MDVEALKVERTKLAMELAELDRQIDRLRGQVSNKIAEYNDKGHRIVRINKALDLFESAQEILAGKGDSDA